ncbi:L-aminoadipate-semialdehyde dehydrogenase-phosphopantetheinyl transferase [Euwallacea similis]|uniref:L-aminoadipate-semialdehyde dehydrogenase-phosphopantetheinyl transferase n=1 Tax=Euwallacea similis TaxID=1736056 RepID=UPI00344C9831
MSQSSVRWCFNLSKWSPTYPELLLATSCIQPEEKLRLGRFVFAKDFKSSLIGRLMMRKFASESCGKKYENLTFIRDERGRPLLSPTESVTFNVSHQGDYTVLAGEVDSDVLLGIDVMKLEYTGGKPLSEFFRIMDRNFSTIEWGQIYSSSDQLKTFCRLWSLKESYTKAIGLGITVKLNEISFQLTSPLSMNKSVCNTKLFVNGREMVEWRFSEILLDEFHCVAVATNKEVADVRFRELNFGGLMQNARPLLPPDEGYCLEYFKKPERPV